LGSAGAVGGRKKSWSGLIRAIPCANWVIVQGGFSIGPDQLERSRQNSVPDTWMILKGSRFRLVGAVLVSSRSSPNSIVRISPNRLKWLRKKAGWLSLDSR